MRWLDGSLGMIAVNAMDSGRALVMPSRGNFVIYDRSEKHLRPQLMPYVGSFGAAVITATWQPGNPEYLVKGYQSAVTQAWVGSLINVLLGEFAPEITRKLRKNKK
jgi:membrane protein YqaA with SNARE-associated domain